MATGAEVLSPLADRFYGDRTDRLRDPFGQQRILSQRIEDVSPEGDGASCQVQADDLVVGSIQFGQRLDAVNSAGSPELGTDDRGKV